MNLGKIFGGKEKEVNHIEDSKRFMSFVVKDDKGETYNLPMFLYTVGLAIRTVASWLKDSSSVVSKFPEDFTLYHNGYYDDRFGTLEPLERNIRIIRADEIMTYLQHEKEKQENETVSSGTEKA